MQNEDFGAGKDWGRFPALRGPHRADAVVVGGGLIGITTALWLCKAGLRVILLEAETLASGATSRCSGMLSLVDRCMLGKLEKQQGAHTADRFLHAQMASFGAIRTMAEEAGDHFGWQDADAEVIAHNQQSKLKREASVLRRAGVSADAAFSGSTPLPGNGVLLIHNMATLNPYLYFHYLVHSSLRLGLRIHEHTRVNMVETDRVQTWQGVVRAPYIVVATGYPIINIPGWYFLRLWQRRRSHVSLAGKTAFDGMLLDAKGRFGLCKWQDGMRLQLDGGMVGQQGKEDVATVYARQYAAYFGGAEITGIKHGVETFSADGLPYIGAYSRKTPNLFVAAGYGGRGLLGSMTAARLISARVLGLNEESAHVFSGQRNGGIVRGMEIASAAAMAGRYVFSKTHLFAPRCPHMGCKLTYSPENHLWECPCHGSRFDDIGHLLNAPSVEDVMIRRRRF